MVIITRAGGGSFEIARPRSMGVEEVWKLMNKGVGGLTNWITFMDVICLSPVCQIKANQSNLLTLKISQSIKLNGAHVIEITKACAVAFMRARNSLVVRCKEKRANWEKKTKKW